MKEASRMASFKEGRIPEQKLQDGRLFPKVLVPAHQSQREEIKAVVDSITESRDWLHNELRHCGVLLFKGFAVRSASDFNDFVEALGWEEQPYIGYALRDHVVGRIQTANDGPLDQDIFFHHEMSTMKVWPSKVLFFCPIAPPEGGQTAVVQSHRVAERVETKFPEIVQRLESEGLLCLTTMPKEDKAGGITKRWQSHFGTDDPVEAEKRAAASGTRIQWMEDGSADMILGPLPAIKLFEGYDRKVLFNSVPISTFVKPCTKRFTFCDGSPIPSAMVEECINIMNEECVEPKWEAGDVLLIDNLAVMHARRPSKPPQRVLAAMCK